MARAYGQIMSAIWNDPEFRALTGDAQRVYLMLVTQAEISSAGTLALTIRRWARYAIDTPSDSLLDSLSELSGQRFVVVDEASEELLVRKFVKWDGGHTNPKRLPAIRAAANAATSPRIRAALAAELDSLNVSHDITDALSDSQSHALSDRQPDSPRVVVTLGELDSTTHNPQPTTLKPQKSIRSAEPSKPDRFDEFWNIFPKKVAKQAARRRWDALIKRGTDPQAIINGAKAYAAHVRDTEPQFVKQPDGWLNAGRWEDEPSTRVPRPYTPWAGS